ncbi:MAG TPA: cupin domain-containing protein [Kofleriaceae bacterium]|nr:cupin domain-containing protein [Kofleriaceae bacterium]
MPQLLFDESVGIRGDELERLVAPLPVEEFVRHVLGRKPLHIRGARDKFSGFFDEDGFWAALGRIPQPKAIRVVFPRPVENDAILRAFISADQARMMFRASGYLFVDPLSTAVPKLASFAAAIKAQLAYPGDVHFVGFLSADGRGPPQHFDDVTTITMQLRGAKTWRYSTRPSVPWPRGAAFIFNDGLHYVRKNDPLPEEPWEKIDPLTEDDFAEVTLEEGDLFTIPAGHFHQCRTGGSSFSLALSFEPLSMIDVAAAALRRRLRSDPAWRSVPPFRGPGDPALDRYLRDMSSALMDQLAAMRERPDELMAAWAASVADVHGGDASISPDPGPEPVGPDDMLARPALLPVVTVPWRDGAGGAGLLVQPGPREVKIEGVAAPLVREALARASFRAGDAREWSGVRGVLTWPRVAAELGRLLQARALERRP